MLLTNRLNLPEPILRAIRNVKYDRGASDITVTELIGPAQIRYLKKRHWDEMEEDAADRVWSMQGSFIHGILESNAKDIPNLIVETRLYAAITVEAGTTVVLGGQFDMYDVDRGELTDYKNTSVWSIAGKPEWEAQLNVLAYLLVANGYDKPNALRIIALLRDWKKRIGGTGDYPRQPIVIIEVEQWENGRALGYIKERLQQHTLDPPPPCTDEERWTEPETFAVMKKNTKKAIKLFRDKQEAIDWAAGRIDFSVVHRPAEYRRCQEYCQVAQFCPQWAAELAKAPF